jgi:hypothetical protein
MVSPMYDGRREDNPRVPHRGEVSFGTHDRTNSALLDNISPNGMGLLTPVVYPPGTLFEFGVETSSGLIEAIAEVRWTRLLAARNRPELKFEMGIRIDEPPDGWGAMVTRATAAAPAPEKPALFLRFMEPANTAPLINDYVQSDSAHIAGDDEPEHGDLVLVPATLPEIKDTGWALGRVAQVRRRAGSDPGGVGLRYLRLMAGDEPEVRGDLKKLAESTGLRILDVTLAPG